MCGIVGWIDWEKNLTAERTTVEKMAASLSHRGPDAQGVWLSKRAALAHRRLIVIDPVGGTQPMIFENGRQIFSITFNGEIYNFHELRGELEKKGHHFKTHSDTEVILHSYMEWGEDCVLHLNGIFAFGLWDEAEQRLFLARDHLGVKPLFYAMRGTSVLFGSEIKALLAHPLVKPAVSSEGLAQMFSPMVYTPGFTIFKDVLEVAPGRTVTFQNGRSSIRQYWKLKSAPHEDSLNKTVERVRELLDDTVRRQLVADVPVVSMLSGGLDSSGITALAAREFKRDGRKLSSYSVDFTDHEKHFTPNLMHLSLDTPWALKVAEHAGTDQHTIVLSSDDLLENLMVPTLAHDVPAMGQMETSLYLLFKAMKQDATVALSGESADEVFGGYPWFFNSQALNANTFPWLALFEGARQPIQDLLSKDLATTVSPGAYAARRYTEAIAEVPALAGESPTAAKMREVFYLNQTRFLPILLDRKDRMSMAVGFEVRVPFCDYRIVDYLWNIPWEMKAVDSIEKGLLRRVLSPVLPHDVLYRRKSPYPATQDPKYVAGVRSRALDILNNPNARVKELVDVAALRALTQNSAGDAKIQHLHSPLERLVQIEGWLEKYQITFC